MPKKYSKNPALKKISLISLVILFILSITLIIVNNQKNLKSTLIKTRADEEVTPTPPSGKSCNLDTSADAAPSCEFYEKCSENFCQYNQNWGEDISPLQVLAIYNRLKSDLGIDFSFLFDKDRINSLQNGTYLARIKFDSLCLSATSRVMDENGKFVCNLEGLDDPAIQKTLDDMKLPTILKGLYPNLSDENIALLEKKLREVNLKSTMGKTSLELILLEIDIMSAPYFAKDIGQLGLKTLTSGSKELLPKFLGIIKTGKQFFFDREGINALRTISTHSSNNAVDLAAQMQAYLRKVKPSLIIRNTKGERVQLWKPMDVLSPQMMIEVDDALSIVRPSVYERLGVKNTGAQIYFIDDIRRILGNRSGDAVFLKNLGIMVLDIKTIPKGAGIIVRDIIHEDIHFILQIKGIRKYIENFAGQSNSKKYFWNLRAFDEGLTDYLTEYFMKIIGFSIENTPYQTIYKQQIEAVNQLLGGGKYVEVLINAIRTGDFKYFLNAYSWTPNKLFQWIIGNLKPVSQSHHENNLSLDKVLNLFKAHAASEEPDYSDPNYEANIISNLSFEYKEQADATTINKSSYSLVSEIDRIMSENNLNEFPIEDEYALKSLVLAGSILNELNDKHYVSIEDIKKTSDELDNLTVEEYNPNEYEEKLPPIGTDAIPIPSEISTDTTNNQDQTESTITPTYTPFPTFD
ncbi:hypothetical protein HY029_01050 [Candidatus Gottesmanbacteria bacterium]|nr:hypothetical protein [Candidatus Gottesmanbacteria bacterium]